MSEVNAHHIIRSLNTINQFVDGRNTISSGQNFVNILNTSKQLLKDIGKQRNTPFYLQRVKDYPDILESEIDELIKKRTGERMFFYYIGGWLLGALAGLVSLIKTKGRTSNATLEKLRAIQHLNNTFLSTLRQPGLENLVMDERSENI